VKFGATDNFVDTMSSTVYDSSGNNKTAEVTKTIRSPTLDDPLTNEEVIDALIVLRKGILAAGYTYEEAMTAMKTKMAAKLLKTVPIDELRKDIIDSVLLPARSSANTATGPPATSQPTVPTLVTGTPGSGPGPHSAYSLAQPRHIPLLSPQTPANMVPAAASTAKVSPGSYYVNTNGTQSPALNPFESFTTSSPAMTPSSASTSTSVTPALSGSLLGGPSVPISPSSALNPFDVEISRRKADTACNSLSSDSAGSGSQPQAVPTTTAFEDARLKRTHTDPNKNLLKTTSYSKLDAESALRQQAGGSHTLVSVGSSSKLTIVTSGHETPVSSEPSPGLVRSGSYRGQALGLPVEDSALNSLARTGSHRGQSLVSPELPSPTGPDGRGLLRTASKKGQSLASLAPSQDPNSSLRLLRPNSVGSSLATVREEDAEISTNPLRYHRAGSFTARNTDEYTGLANAGSLGKIHSEDEMSPHISSHSLLSVANTVPVSLIPLAPKSARADMFHRDDSNSNNSGGHNSGPNSAPGSGSVSHSSSMSGGGFEILLKKQGSEDAPRRRNSLDEAEAQQHVMKALQEHASQTNISGRMQGPTPDSRGSRTFSNDMRRSPSIDKEEMSSLRNQHNTSPNIYGSAPTQARRLSKTYSDSKDELLESFSDRVSDRTSSDLSSPGIPGGISSGNHSARTNVSGSPMFHMKDNSHPSHEVPPHPEFLGRTSSRRGDLTANAGKFHSRSTDNSSGDHDHSSVRHHTVPPMALSLDSFEQGSAGLDIVSTGRIVDQIMQDPFWDDMDNTAETHAGNDKPVSTSDVNHKNAPRATAPGPNLANVLSAASQAMSELDAMLDMDSVPSSGAKKMHQHGHHHSSKKHGSADDEKVVFDDTDEIVTAFRTAVPVATGSANKPPVGRARSPALTSEGSVHLDDYPAIRRKVDEMSQILRSEGYSIEDIQATIKTQSLADLKDIKEINYFRILVDSTRTTRKQQESSGDHSHGSQHQQEHAYRSHTPTHNIAGVPRTGQARLLKDIKITVRFPEKGVTSTLSLQRGCTYIDVLTTVMADVTCNVPSPVMYAVDSNGWCREISREGKYSNSCECSLFDLSDGSIVEIRELATASVGGRFRMALIADADRNNDSLFYKVKSLCKTYAGYKKIRGDGNCYYRAVVYGALEQIIKERNRQAFRFMYETFKSVLFSNREHNTDHNELLAAFAAAAGKQLSVARCFYVLG
jgi:hypothetical protein